MTKLLLSGVLGALALAPAQAQTLPDRPVKIVVASSAGAIIEILAREFGQIVGKAVGQPVNIENLAGADQQIGTAAVARAKPDGDTLLLVSRSSTAPDPAPRASLPYNTAAESAADSRDEAENCDFADFRADDVTRRGAIT